MFFKLQPHPSSCHLTPSIPNIPPHLTFPFYPYSLFFGLILLSFLFSFIPKMPFLLPLVGVFLSLHLLHSSFSLKLLAALHVFRDGSAPKNNTTLTTSHKYRYTQTTERLIKRVYDCFENWKDKIALNLPILSLQV